MANKKDGSCTLRILEKTNIIYLLWFLSNNILWSIVLVSNIDHIGSSGNCRSLERRTRCGLANRSSSKWPIANRLHAVSWWDLYWSVTLGQAKLFEDFVYLLQTWHFFCCNISWNSSTYILPIPFYWTLESSQMHPLVEFFDLSQTWSAPCLYLHYGRMVYGWRFVYITILPTSQYSTWIPFFFFL